MADRVRAILIAGPTASGKSALASTLVGDAGGLVINADSMQVYRDLRVITARPTPEEMAAAPHRLYGHVDGAVNYSVARYLADATSILGEAWKGGRLPIVVGGTGLYFKVLLDGLSAVPPVPTDIREQVRRGSEGRETAGLHADLAGRDPETARAIRPSDRLRVLRALEVLEGTGRPLASFRGQKVGAVLKDTETVRIFLAPDREELCRRIDSRFTRMIEAGGLDEVRMLAERKLDPMLPVMRAHGVPGLLAHLSGACSLDEAIARGQADTRRYAKRQTTWFRHQMPGWIWTAPEEGRAAILADLAQRARAGPN